MNKYYHNYIAFIIFIYFLRIDHAKGVGFCEFAVGISNFLLIDKTDKLRETLWDIRVVSW